MNVLIMGPYSILKTTFSIILNFSIFVIISVLIHIGLNNYSNIIEIHYAIKPYVENPPKLKHLIFKTNGEVDQIVRSYFA